MLFDQHGREIQQPDIHDPQEVEDLDRELLARMAAEIAILQAADAAVLLALPPLTAIQLAGLIQLALRHDGIAGDIRDAGDHVLAGVRAFFADHAAPAVLEVLARGDDLEQDV